MQVGDGRSLNLKSSSRFDDEDAYMRPTTDDSFRGLANKSKFNEDMPGRDLSKYNRKLK